MRDCRPRGMQAYATVSFLAPVLLGFLSLFAANLLGEGVSGGSADFLPSFLLKHAPFRQGDHPTGLSLVLGFAAKVEIAVFVISLVNLPVVGVILALRWKKRRSG